MEAESCVDSNADIVDTSAALPVICICECDYAEKVFLGGGGRTGWTFQYCKTFSLLMCPF